MKKLHLVITSLIILILMSCTENITPQPEASSDSSSANIMERGERGGAEVMVETESEAAREAGSEESDADVLSPDLTSEAGGIVINEVVSKPTDGSSDWIELFVTGDQPVELSEYALVDDHPDHTPYTLPIGVLNPGEYWVIQMETEDNVGSSFGLPFGLGDRDQVNLLWGEEVIDELSWSEDGAIEGYSFGRLPDGQGEGRLLHPTPGATNALSEHEPQALFPLDEVIEVHLELEAADWRAIQEDPLAEVYYMGHIQYGTERLEDVAIRVKGNSSLNSVARSPSVRFSFKVDMNRYVEGQRLLGVKKLNFNNGFKDPTLMREHLAYEVYRAMGRPAPRTAFVNLTVSGEHMGLYTVVEQVDDLFLDQHFDERSGDLYKPEPPAGQLIDRGDRIEDYEGVGLKTNEETTDHAAFLRFIKVINNSNEGELDQVLHIDDYLLNLAINVVLVNLDSYLGMGHNYYLYERHGIFTEIPWDLNEAFGNFTCGCNRDQLVHFLIDEPTCGSLRSYPLLDRIFQNPAYIERYHQQLRAIIEGAGSLASLSTLIEAKAQLIRPFVESDPSKFFTTAEFETNLTNDIGRRTWGLTSFTEDRISSILRQLDGEEPSTNEGRGNCERGGQMNMGPDGMGTDGMGPNGQNCPPCGDGICDQHESNNPNLCPRDCEDPPAEGDWCGDGICDALESCQRDCPIDCGD